MMSHVSKAATLYLAPVLMLTALLLILFAYLAPTVMLHSEVALLTVTPSTSLTQSNVSGVDGPSIFMGALGSCARSDNSAGVICTSSSLSPAYNTSVLPSDSDSFLLSPPPTTSPGFIAFSIALSLFFFVTFTAISFREKLGPRIGPLMDKPMMQRLSAWIGVFGFLIGLSTFLIIRMWFEEAASDFNQTIESQGTDGPNLIAGAGNGFTMVWVGYAFFAVPVVVSLAKLHVHATK